MNFGCPVRKVTQQGRRRGDPAEAAPPARHRARGGGAPRAACRSRSSSGSASTTRYRPTSTRAASAQEEGCAAVGAARAHGRAALRRRGALGRDRAAEAGGDADPGARQRRHLGGRGRAAHDARRPAATASSSAAAAWAGRGCSATWPTSSRAASRRTRPTSAASSTSCSSTRGCWRTGWARRAAMRAFRKHSDLVHEGLPRRSRRCASALMQVSTLAELETILAGVDRAQPFPPDAMRVPRGKSGGHAEGRPARGLPRRPRRRHAARRRGRGGRLRRLTSRSHPTHPRPAAHNPARPNSRGQRTRYSNSIAATAPGSTSSAQRSSPRGSGAPPTALGRAPGGRPALACPPQPGPDRARARAAPAGRSF